MDDIFAEKPATKKIGVNIHKFIPRIYCILLYLYFICHFMPALSTMDFFYPVRLQCPNGVPNSMNSVPTKF
jgi:hypothetical protein